MKHDEFAFLNHQLAAMLREGMALEPALRRLCADLNRGFHRNEFQKLEAALARGEPLRDALEATNLPLFYKHLAKLGAASGDLPGVLTIAADYYRRVGAIWTCLRGLLTYPFLLVLGSLLLSLWFAILYHSVHGNMAAATASASLNPVKIFTTFGEKPPPLSSLRWWLNLWVPPATLLGSAAILGVILASPHIRARLRWRFGPFKDASLAQLASCLHALTRNGVALPDALRFASNMESSTPAGPELARWAERNAQGHSSFSALAAESRLVPPMFLWIVASSGDDLPGGFAKAAELYADRANRRGELLLNLILPCSLLAIGLMLLGQIQPFVTSVFDIFTPLFKMSEIIGR